MPRFASKSPKILKLARHRASWPYLRIDTTYLKVGRGGRIVSVAVITAVGVNTTAGARKRGATCTAGVKSTYANAARRHRP